MKKKGEKKSAQVTIFIIIAIVIVAAILIFILIRNNGILKSNISPEIKPIYISVENCIKDTAENAVYYVGQTGGYFISPEQSTEFGIAYYYDKGKNLTPTKEIIEKELGDYVDYMLFFCTKNFIDYPDFSVKQGKIKTSAKIKSDRITFEVNYPLSISKSGKTYSFSNFAETSINARLDKIYSIAKNITDDTIKNKENVCISCIYKLAKDLDLYVEINDLDSETTVFTVRDINSEILQMDYRFNFANRY